MINHYLFNCKISKDEAYKIYVDKINNDLRFDKKIDDSILTIEEKYMTYFFIESAIYNHNYFYHNKLTNAQIDGKIDVLYNYSDADFILNELDKVSAEKIDEPEFILFDDKRYEDSYNKFIKKFKNKALSNILKRHSIPLSKSIYIDVAPIEKFDINNIDIYYEKIYIFRYRNINKKDDYISILSSYKKEFYKFEYTNSDDYISFILKNKRPIEYIPKDYLDYYYNEAFLSYLKATKSLNYEEKGELISKIKKNLQYEAYSLHEDYLKMGIYYFKIRKYLKKLKINESKLKLRIFYSYLTLSYQSESGVFLYKCAALGLLNISKNEEIRFLQKSYKLKSLESKKLLYEHYSSMDYYDESMLRKYS